MTIADYNFANIVETTSASGLPTGNVYKLADVCHWDRNYRYAYRAFGQGRVKLAMNCPCRLVEPRADSPEFQF